MNCYIVIAKKLDHLNLKSTIFGTKPYQSPSQPSSWSVKKSHQLPNHSTNQKTTQPVKPQTIHPVNYLPTGQTINLSNTQSDNTLILQSIGQQHHQPIQPNTKPVIQSVKKQPN